MSLAAAIDEVISKAYLVSASNIFFAYCRMMIQFQKYTILLLTLAFDELT